MIGLELKRPDLVGIVDRLLLLRELWRWHLPMRGGNQWLHSVLLASPLANFKHSFVRRWDRVRSPDIIMSGFDVTGVSLKQKFTSTRGPSSFNDAL